MVKHSRIGQVRIPRETKRTFNEVKYSLYKKCTEISLLYDIQIFVAITDDKHNLSVLSTKTEVSEYISSALKAPLNATEIFTSKSFSKNDTESSDSEEDDHKDKDSSLVNATTLSQTFSNRTEQRKNNYRIKIPLLNAKASINGKEYNVIKNNKNNLILFKNKDNHSSSVSNSIISKVDNKFKEESSIKIIPSIKSVQSNFTIKIPIIKEKSCVSSKNFNEDILMKDDSIKDGNIFSIFTSNGGGTNDFNFSVDPYSNI